MIKVFIGCSEMEWLPARVAEFSLLKKTSSNVNVVYMYRNLIPHDMPKDKSNQPATNFSFQRFMIPQLCNFEGRGIYMDSDVLLFHDIKELWEQDMRGCKILKAKGWQSAVMLIDCTIGWRISQLITMMDAKTITYPQMMNLKGIGATICDQLDPRWNTHDREKWMEGGKIPKDTRILHYTKMDTQPWLYAAHRYGKIWTDMLLQAIKEGFISQSQVDEEIRKGHVRPSLCRLFGERTSNGIDYRTEDLNFVPPHRRPKG